MTTDEAKAFCAETLASCWPQMADMEPLEREVYVERLLPFTPPQAEAGVKALLAEGSRRFKPCCSDLIQAVVKATGQGRDPAYGPKPRPKAIVVGPHGVCIVCETERIMQPFLLPDGRMFHACRSCYEAIQSGGIAMPRELLPTWTIGGAKP